MNKQRVALIAVFVLLIAMACRLAFTYPQWGYSPGFCVLPGESFPPEEVPASRKRYSFLPGNDFRLEAPLPSMSTDPRGNKLTLNVFPSPFTPESKSVGKLVVDLPLGG